MRYALDRMIDAGGAGEVWRAVDPASGQMVALKRYALGAGVDDMVGVRFEREVGILARLRHPGIAPLLDVGHDHGVGDQPGAAYVVMPLLDGESLRDHLRDPLPPAELTAVVGQVATALAALHEGSIVHRGLRPSRIFLTADRVLLTDFGHGWLIGRREDDATYIAPEVVAGGLPSAAADVYSLGCIAYEALAGRPPFAGDSPLAVALAHVRDEPPPLPAAVAPPIRGAVMRALAKQPAQRWPTTVDLAEALRAA